MTRAEFVARWIDAPAARSVAHPAEPGLACEVTAPDAGASVRPRSMFRESEASARTRASVLPGRLRTVVAWIVASLAALFGLAVALERVFHYAAHYAETYLAPPL